MQPLALNISPYGEEEHHVATIRDNLKRSVPRLTPSLIAHDGTFVVVGSGPSLPSVLEEIREERAKGRPICAAKGAHDLLCENGLEPDLFVSVEPRARLENVKHKSQNTTYLLASRCSGELFDYLADCKVVMWHSLNSEAENKVLPGQFIIGGGTTSGMRAINIGYVLGFRSFRLYGMDSCMKDGIKRFTGEGAPYSIPVICGGEVFQCNGAMAQQANEFQELYKVMPDATFEAIGGGLIAKILSERRRLGRPA